ncbi:MAG: type II toxin-antitoxin system RatA family toxin [Gammaproteobacteria bacterium]
MASVKRSALLSYSAEQMFALVADIESYPQFLPWCRSTTVHSRNGDEVHASVELAKGSVHKTFSTVNRMQKDKMIEMRLVDGPFKHLQGFWQFTPLDEKACRVSVDMDFEFSNRLVGMAFGPIFNQAMSSLVDAFVERARVVYGK